MSHLDGLTLKQVLPSTPAEELLEAQAWGFETVEEFYAAMTAAMDEYQQEIEAFQ